MKAGGGNKLLVVQVAALGHDFFLERHGRPQWKGCALQAAETVFPALTCPVQASFRTASWPREHGVTFNGKYFPELGRPMFWEQSARLVKGRRFWEDARAAGKTVGMLFWQQSLGEQVDLLLSPAPIHKHHGGMVEAFHSKPPGRYEELCRVLGKSFKLRHYWGPLASRPSSEWIAEATAAAIAAPDAPDLLLSYIPHLDYALQRHGPASPQAAKAFGETMELLGRLADAAVDNGRDFLFYGDYAIAPAGRAVLPNVLLRRAGLLKTRSVGKMLYPDFPSSRAFAVADHETAHVFLDSPASLPATLAALQAGTADFDLLGQKEASQLRVDAPDAAALVLAGKGGNWFAYPWWDDPREAPDYARHIDIHNKPGFDPCELFFGWPPLSITLDTTRIKGTHGLAGPSRQIAWLSTLPLQPATPSLPALAAEL